LISPKNRKTNHLQTNKIHQIMARPHFSHTVIDQAYHRQRYRCAICGESLRKLWNWYGEKSAAHHIRRVADGGSHTLDNCAILCETCHQQAHNWGNFRQPVEILRHEFEFINGSRSR